MTSTGNDSSPLESSGSGRKADAAREQQRLDEARWRNLLERSPFGIVIYRPDGTIRASNRAMQEIFETSDDEHEFLLAHYNILQDPQLESKGWSESIRRAFAGESTVFPTIEYEVVTPLEQRPVRKFIGGVAYPVHDDAGKLLEVVTIQRDFTALAEAKEELRRSRDALDERVAELESLSARLTQEVDERKQAESRIRESEQRFRELADNIQEVFWLFDWIQQRVVYVSPAYETIWGRPVTRLYEDYSEWGESVHPEDRARAAESFAEVAETGGGEVREYRIVRPDGEVRWVSDRAFAVRNDAAEVVRVAGVAMDVTDRKQQEEARRQLEERVQQAQKLESLGVLAGGIAHDFNNLLLSVLGNADLALAQLKAESPATEFLTQIVKAAERAAELTRQMLAYSGRGAFHVEVIQLDQLVEEMAHLLEAVISKKATLQLLFDREIPVIQGDASQVRQVVMNLITNAAEALGSESGTVRLCTGVVEVEAGDPETDIAGDELPAGHYVTLEVSDTGCGMDEETRRRIFEPFYTTKFSGRGLGLASVLGIVRSHGGTIRVESRPGKGTRFTVLLPAAREVGPQPPPHQPAAQEESNGRTILVVDDDPDVLKVARRMLERAGFRTLTAADGQEGLELFRRHHEEVELVLLDLTMPKMDGAETFRQMRGIQSDVRVVLSSGYGEQETLEQFNDGALAGFVQKPYRSTELLASVHEVLGQG